MFEEYLQDSHHFGSEALSTINDREAKRSYRAAIFYAASSMESFINFISEILSESGELAAYEVALLFDKRFALENGKFELIDRFELHGVEEKIRFLIYKVDPSFDFATFSAWSQYLEFKDLRNKIVHPIHGDDEISVDEYKNTLKRGFHSIIEIINFLCQKIIGKPLRRNIAELAL